MSFFSLRLLFSGLVLSLLFTQAEATFFKKIKNPFKSSPNKSSTIKIEEDSEIDRLKEGIYALKGMLWKQDETIRKNTFILQQLEEDKDQKTPYSFPPFDPPFDYAFFAQMRSQEYKELAQEAISLIYRINHHQKQIEQMQELIEHILHEKKEKLLNDMTKEATQEHLSPHQEGDDHEEEEEKKEVEDKDPRFGRKRDRLTKLSCMFDMQVIDLKLGEHSKHKKAPNKEKKKKPQKEQKFIPKIRIEIPFSNKKSGNVITPTLNNQNSHGCQLEQERENTPKPTPTEEEPDNPVLNNLLTTIINTPTHSRDSQKSNRNPSSKTDHPLQVLSPQTPLTKIQEDQVLNENKETPPIEHMILSKGSSQKNPETPTVEGDGLEMVGDDYNEFNKSNNHQLLFQQNKESDIEHSETTSEQKNNHKILLENTYQSTHL